MTYKAFKPILICLLSLSVLSLKNRLKVHQIAEPEKNMTPPEQGNVTAPAAEQQNMTQLPTAGQQNATQIPEAGQQNMTQIPGAADNATQIPQEPGQASLGKSQQENVIKIRAIYENPNIQSSEGSNLTQQTGEASKQNEQKLQETIQKLKELGLKDENILNLGVSFTTPKKLKQNKPTLYLQQNHNETNGSKNLVATSELDVQVNDSDLAEKVLDVFKSQGFKIVSINYKHDPKILQKVYTSNANDAAPLICIWILGVHICI